MDLEASLELKPQVYHFFPLCCLPPWTMGRYLFYLIIFTVKILTNLFQGICAFVQTWNFAIYSC